MCACVRACVCVRVFGRGAVPHARGFCLARPHRRGPSRRAQTAPGLRPAREMQLVQCGRVISQSPESRMRCATAATVETPSNFHPDMLYINIPIDALTSSEYRRSKPVKRATWLNLLTGNIAAPVSNNPFLFTPANYFTKPTGILIIKDKASSVADTSAYFTLEMANGLEEGFGLNQVVIYPNPANEFIAVKSNAKILQLSVIDLQGREVAFADGNQVSVELLKPGIYFLKIVGNNEEVIVKSFQKF